MKVLVIGASGQLARSLIENAAGRPGIVLTTLARPQIDLADPVAIAAIDRVDADAIVNAAAYTAVDRAEDEADLAYAINAEAAGALAALARRSDARFVQISTDYVFDGAASDPYTEDAPTNPLNVYGRSKLEGEKAVRAADPGATIVRTAWVYSPFGSNFLRTMVALGSERERVRVVDDQFGNPSAAGDLANGLFAMIDSWAANRELGLGRTYHLAGTGITNWAGFASRIFTACRKLGLPIAEVDPIPSSQWPTRAPRPRNSALDCRAFAHDFSYAMPPWEESVSSVLAAIVGSSVTA